MRLGGRYRTYWRYGAAVLLTALALAVRPLLAPALGQGYAFILFYPAVAAAAWTGGFGPGALATLLSSLAATVFLLDLSPAASRADVAALAVFAAMGVAISALAGAAHSARRRTEHVTQKLIESEERLRQRAGELEEADRRKDEFLALLAHELRNPLAAISNAAYVLDQVGHPEEEATRLRRIISRQTTHLSRLVEDLLDTARIAHGKVDLRREEVDLTALLREALDGTAAFIESRSHILSVSLPSEPLLLVADPTRLEQVFGNLLTNAARYTPPGGRISVSAAREGTELVVRVRDTGEGIPPEMLTRVFDLFTQVEAGSGRSQGGLGLGLPLARSLVEMHEGTVEAHSDGRHQGSEFVVRLPLPKAEGESRKAEGGPERAFGPSAFRLPPSALRRVLLGDDEVEAVETLAEIIRLWGYEVGVAHTGPAVLEAAAALQPEAVILDLAMPGLDGCEVARHLRQQPGSEGLVLIALTGHGRELDRQRAREAGFQHYLLKPVDPDDLRRMLSASPREHTQRDTDYTD